MSPVEAAAGKPIRSGNGRGQNQTKVTDGQQGEGAGVQRQGPTSTSIHRYRPSRLLRLIAAPLPLPHFGPIWQATDLPLCRGYPSPRMTILDLCTRAPR